MESNITLTPIQEMAPGQVTAIRNSIIDSVVKMASKGLSLPESSLVVRDIRAYDDIGFGNNTAFMATAITHNCWGAFKAADTYIVTAASPLAYVAGCAATQTMADMRYCAIYGVRDWRMARPTSLIQEISLIKFDIGNADRVVWNLAKVEAYTDFMAGIAPTAIVIPPNTPFQIYPYLIAGGVAQHLQLMGFIVEPVGLLLTP